MSNTTPYTITQYIPVSIDLSYHQRYQKLHLIASDDPIHPLSNSILAVEEEENEGDTTESLILSAYTSAPLINPNPNYWYHNLNDYTNPK